jgi:hypothetical protein
MSDLKKFVADKVLDLFIDHFAKKAWDEYSRQKRRSLHNEFKNKVKANIDSELFRKYKDKRIYDRISRILIIDNKIDLIFNRCYNRDINDFSNDDEFINEIIGNNDMSYIDYQDTIIILRSLISSVFKTLNEPQSETERRIITTTINTINPIARDVKDLSNSFSDFKASRNLVTREKSIMENWSNLDMESKIELFNNKKYFVSLRNKTINSIFIVKIYIEYTEDIQKSGGIKNYIEIRDQQNQVIMLPILKIEIWEDANIQFSKNYSSSNLPAIEFGVFELKELDFELIDNMQKMEDPSLKAIPQKKYVFLDIEVSNNEVLFSNLKFEMSKHSVSGSKTEYKLNSVNGDICSIINMVWTFPNGENKVLNTKFKITIQNSANVRHRLQHYLVLEKILKNNEFVIRESTTKSLIAKGSDIVQDKITANYKEHIDFFTKVLKIQDYFRVNFTLPNDIFTDDEQLVRIVYDLITIGYAKVVEKPYDLEIVPIDFEKLNNVGSYNNKILYRVNVESIEIFGFKINLNMTAEKVIMNGSLESLGRNIYRLSTNSPAVVVYKPVFGDDDIVQKAIEIIA